MGMWRWEGGADAGFASFIFDVLRTLSVPEVRVRIGGSEMWMMLVCGVGCGSGVEAEARFLPIANLLLASAGTLKTQERKSANRRAIRLSSGLQRDQI
jgi:hypothetical protein